MASMSGYGSASGRGEHSVPGLGPTLDRVTTVPSAPPPRDSGDSYAGSPKTSAWHQPQIPWVRNWIVQNKRFLFALCFATLVISFNGRWRIGLDSSIYRGLAASLAN